MYIFSRNTAKCISSQIYIYIYIYEFAGRAEPCINLQRWFKTTISSGCTVSKFVPVQSWTPTCAVGFWIVALYLRAILKAYLGDKTSQFRGNDTEDHGRWIICIVLRDSSFIIDDYSERCTCFHVACFYLACYSVCRKFYGSVLICFGKIAFFNNLI